MWSLFYIINTKIQTYIYNNYQVLPNKDLPPYPIKVSHLASAAPFHKRKDRKAKLCGCPNSKNVHSIPLIIMHSCLCTQSKEISRLRAQGLSFSFPKFHPSCCPALSFSPRVPSALPPSKLLPSPLFSRSAEGDPLTMPLSQSLGVSSTNRPW